MARKNPGIAGLDDRLINEPCTPEETNRNWRATRKALADLDRAPEILNALGDIDVQDATIENLTVTNIIGKDIAAWVALVPCGLTIPARVGAAAGWASCCLYILESETPAVPGRTLTAVTDQYGNPVRVVVNNVYSSPVTEGYVKIDADENGNWMNDTPPSTEGSNTTTTTTTSTTTTQWACEGRCKWIWVSDSQEWVLASEDCTLTPPTTTTTSTSTSTTCVCPPDTTVNTTTTTTSTTTTPFCRCQYPTFCGENGGECTYTGCITGVNDLELPCTTTTSTSTSTSCDCATTSTSTSTTLPSTCQEGCRWGWVKDLSTDQYHWLQISDGCSPDCPCSAPEVDGFPCEDIVTPCVVTQETDCEYACTGDCTWMWFHDTWILMRTSCDEFCTSVTEGICQCVKPSFDGNELCQIFKTACQRPEQTTTTPADPCWRCYTTTSTTTTSTSTTGCNGYCTYNWSTAQNGWVFVRSDCSQWCPCGQPAMVGFEDCEYTKVPCGSGTTSTSTTTTPPCTGTCVFNCANFGGGRYYWTLTESDCNATCNCPPSIACQECNPAETLNLTVNCCKDFDHNGDCLEPDECIGSYWYCKGGILGTPCSVESSCVNVIGETFEAAYPGFVRCGGPWDSEENCNAACTTTTTTTTTTSTTTTTGPMGACCCPEGFGFSATCQQTTEEDCSCEPRQSQWYEGQTCEAIGCPPGCSGSCLWASDGNAWYQFSFCDDGCECAYPDVPATMGGATSTSCLSPT